MANHGDYVIAYDISSDEERRRVSKVPEGFGVRSQASVFECRLTAASKKALLGRLDALAIDTGYIDIYRVQNLRRRSTFGVAPRRMCDESQYAVVI